MKLELLSHSMQMNKKGVATMDDFKVGRYFVRRTISPMSDGEVWTRIQVQGDRDAEYLPPIQYDDDVWSDNPNPRFEIQTTAYGAKGVEDIEKVIAGYQEALEVVNLLTEKFLK